jgi:tripartite-type tricarboxylate transporter receptor subunit TctC
LPVKTVKELIALAKSKPGALSYATSGVGSPEHFAGEMFKMMTKTDMLPIPYKGGAPLAVDLVGGQVMLAFNTAPPIMPHIQSGRVRAIAVTMDKRVGALPDVPTIAESGVPGYQMSTWYGAVIQTKTPRDIVVKLNQEMIKALALPDIKERMAGLGADVVGNTMDEFAALIKVEVAKYTKVAHTAGIVAD